MLTSAQPVTSRSRRLPRNIIEATSRARALGLTDLEQVTRVHIPPADEKKRLLRMRRLVLGAGDQIQAAHQRASRRYRVAMLTLTYRDVDGWEPKHVSTCMQRIRDWLARRGHKLHAVWVMELQKRGAPHYHVVVWLPKGLTIPKPDKQGWWPHGHTNCTWAKRPVGYLAKYATKGNTTEWAFPKGARIYGIYGAPVHLGWWRAPKWMREIAARGMRITKHKGGWWRVEDMAHAWRSPWRMIDFGPNGVEVEWVGWGNNDVIDLWTLDKWLKLEAKA